MLEILSNHGFFKNKKLIIFDFDGTICNTEPVAISVFNEMASEYYKDPITSNLLPQLKRMSAQEFIFKYLKISPWRLPFIVYKFRKKMNKRFSLLRPFVGIKELIEQLKNQGKKLVIISSSSKDNINRFVKDNNIDLFDQIFAEVGLFGKSRKILRAVKKMGVSKEDTVMIGDEIRDFEASQKSEVDIISVSWGMQTLDALLKVNPKNTVKTVAELESLIV